jgi:hypothetical protein
MNNKSSQGSFMNDDKNAKRKAPKRVPVEFGLSEAIAAAMAGTLNDWRADSLLMSALGERSRRPPRGRRATGESDKNQR